MFYNNILFILNNNLNYIIYLFISNISQRYFLNSLLQAFFFFSSFSYFTKQLRTRK